MHLAWFSSVTHQACLTFLRPYLYQRPVEPIWRLVLLCIVCALLVVALVPTANYDWGQGVPEQQSTDEESAYHDRPAPADYALCYFKIREEADVISVAISIAFIVVGYIARVVRLYRTLSVRWVGGARKTVRRWLQGGLKVLHRGIGAANSPNRLTVLFVYRPLVAIFLLLTVLVDLWSSMFFEVGLTRVSWTLKCNLFISTTDSVPSSQSCLGRCTLLWHTRHVPEARH